MIPYRTYTTLLLHYCSGGFSIPWCYGVGTRIQFRIRYNLDITEEQDDIRLCILPFILASSLTWNHRDVTFVPDGATGSEPQQLTIAIGLLRRCVLKALKAYRKDHQENGASEPCPEIWMNRRGHVEEVVPESHALDSSETAGLDPGDEGEIPASTYPDDRKLDSTIRYLE